jgi:hypothetical protein
MIISAILATSTILSADLASGATDVMVGTIHGADIGAM